MKKTKEITLENFIENVQTGHALQFRNMTVIPLFSNNDERTRYLTLQEALKLNLIDIFEKNEGASVPELRVVNKSGKRILIVDAEELAGAKQNRILNTTILLKKHSETIIPVSCTESGRWNYTSDKFSDSGNIALPELRIKKSASVSYSLDVNNEYHSDQGEVWDSVEDFFVDAKMDSPTRSMKDVYDNKKNQVNDYMEAFGIKDSQRGFIVIIDGKIVGLEYFSYTKAFSLLYEKILRSYAMEAYLKRGTYEKPGEKTISEFIERLKQSQTTVFKSPGHGYDHRIAGTKLSGNMLVYRNEVIHLAAFNQNESRESFPRYRF
jgi:hypothetical protein